MGWGARWLGFPFGQGTRGTGERVAEGGCVAEGVPAGEEMPLGLPVALGSGLSTSERKLPMRMATATTVLTATASTPTMMASRRQRAGGRLGGSPPLEGSLRVGPLAGLSAGAGRPGSSVVTVDQLEPSQ